MRQTIMAIPAALLLTSCPLFQPTPAEGSTEWAAQFFRGLGDAAMRVDGTAAIAKYAPDLLPLLDVGVPDGEGGWPGRGDGVVTLEEFERVVGAAMEPTTAAMLATVVYAKLREMRER
jgi:hypothetical protein